MSIFKQGCQKRDHLCINDEKLGQSYIFSQKKGAYRIPGSTEKVGYSARTSVLYHIYVVPLHPPPPPPRPHAFHTPNVIQLDKMTE